MGCRIVTYGSPLKGSHQLGYGGRGVPVGHPVNPLLSWLFLELNTSRPARELQQAPSDF